MNSEPPSLEIWLTILVGKLAGSTYQEYVDRLPLKGNERVLELGPSAGNSTRFLAERLLQGGGCVTAVDISDGWTRIARKRLSKYPNVECRSGDIASMNLPNKSYDAAFMNFVLHDIPPPDRVREMQGLAHKLIRGGRVFLREPLDRITPAEIERAMGESGFIKDVSTIGEMKTQGKVYEGTYHK